ncbi:S8 family serine peptidase [Streptacidiphilus rugosus]|uniref:S8 family serine peptidase n=1 Tax=Streptacidiphilus rugosus TaxID=405783 RepID=UPI00056BFD48|nr:S8 family serine peptidase [Streptacidiphilus rugosus]
MGTTPVAHADEARSAQWALSAYDATKSVWNHSKGKGITVAVIDSGVRASHIDLSGQVLAGKDFAFGGDGQTDHSPEGHGTCIASVIAAHGHGSNGARGIMGLAPEAKILPIGVGDGVTGSLGSDYLAPAIHYAVDHHAQVINISLGSADPSAADEAAVAYAEQHNVVVVTSSGNSGTSDKEYPGSYPGVIKVGAVDQSGKLWSQSNTGGVTVAAPGVGIVCDNDGNDTQMGKGDGTSLAAAYVSAIAALFRSAHPELTQGQIVNYIIKTADLPKGHTAPDPGFGYGIAWPYFDMKVDPGPAAGPLPQASAASSGDSGSSSAPVAAAPGGSSGGGGSTGLILGGVGGLVVLGLVVALIARARRRPSAAGMPPGGPAPAQPYQPPYQPPTGQYQQQPYQSLPNYTYPPQQQGGHQEQPPR